MDVFVRRISKLDCLAASWIVRRRIEARGGPSNEPEAIGIPVKSQNLAWWPTRPSEDDVGDVPPGCVRQRELLIRQLPATCGIEGRAASNAMFCVVTEHDRRR
jgi:hypothetical protein